jgi:hypothetical protein
LDGFVVLLVRWEWARCVDCVAEEMARRSARMRSCVGCGRGRQVLCTRDAGMLSVRGVRRASVGLWEDDLWVRLRGWEWEREREREGAIVVCARIVCRISRRRSEAGFGLLQGLTVGGGRRASDRYRAERVARQGLERFVVSVCSTVPTKLGQLRGDKYRGNAIAD